VKKKGPWGEVDIAETPTNTVVVIFFFFGRWTFEKD
jgi:hypothetical protein